MINASQARELIVKVDEPRSLRLSKEILNRIQDLVTFVCGQGGRQTSFNTRWYLDEEQNLLTRKSAYDNVVLELSKSGYEVFENNTELTIKW